MTLYEEHKLKCKNQGIKIVRDSFDLNDENLKREVEMLRKENERSLFEKINGNYAQFLLDFLPLFLFYGALIAILFYKG